MEIVKLERDISGKAQPDAKIIVDGTEVTVPTLNAVNMFVEIK